ncbi:GGDEF domain-containing protein [Aquamicrobium segne]|uniref:diguanylate cyclase n=1 Tax=Aquamicrobium segne TaxID=469547 RepID=A0ABW0H121_9HYPH
MKLPSRYVLKRSVQVTLIAAAISISFSTGLRLLVGAKADAITIFVRLVLPFVIAPPIAIVWFSKMEKLERAYRNLLRQSAELARRANTDPLTGLLNRRSFEEQFNMAMAHDIAGKFIIADVDYLKAINDKYGHLTGDDAILSVAAALQAVLGEESLIARIGGDEFCAFIPHAEKGDHDRLLGDINDIANREFGCRTETPELRLSISAGLQMCKPGQTFRAMLEKTDSDLYRKKRSRPQAGM